MRRKKINKETEINEKTKINRETKIKREKYGSNRQVQSLLESLRDRSKKTVEIDGLK